MLLPGTRATSRVRQRCRSSPPFRRARTSSAGGDERSRRAEAENLAQRRALAIQLLQRQQYTQPPATFTPIGPRVQCRSYTVGNEVRTDCN